MFCIPFTFLSCSVPPSPFTPLSSPTFSFCHVLSFLHPPVFTCLHRVPILSCILFSFQYYMAFTLASLASTVSPFPSPLSCPLPLHFSFIILFTGSPSNSTSACNSTPYSDYFFSLDDIFFFYPSSALYLFTTSPQHYDSPYTLTFILSSPPPPPFPHTEGILRGALQAKTKIKFTQHANKDQD